jgi:hypothetical protein
VRYSLMATVGDFWRRAFDLYGRARSSNDPLMKRVLLGMADDCMKRADEMRHGDTRPARPSIEILTKRSGN